MDRRQFNLGLGAGLAAAAIGAPAASQAAYRGPNIVIVRFGGGVRRAETIDAATTYAPYMRHVLAERGVLIPNMRISQMEGGNTSHAEGTLNILTGRYEAYRDAGSGILDDRLEPTEPTLFEYLREAFNIPSHQVLLINGEDRAQEEFFTYGLHGHYGINYRSEMLSLHRFKLHKTARILQEGGLDEAGLKQAEQAYADLLAADHRAIVPEQSAPLQTFWDNWRTHYGDDGFKNPRGDRLLTALALRAMQELRPRLMMINYQDPDYVHWGNASHYTRAISVIDDGLRQLSLAVENSDHYAGNTVFVVVPDCGRDANGLMSVPFQHHFNSRSAHEIWALIFGAGIAKGRVMDREMDQSAIAPTVAALMGFRADRAEGDVLSGDFGMSIAQIDVPEGRKGGILKGPKNLVVGALLAMTPVTAILVLGWLMRDMRRVAIGFAESDRRARPGWILGARNSRGVARALGGLAANIREGLTAFVALALGTLPFAGFWIASWWAGWDNSFNKGYEQSLIGPATGLSGVAIFMVMVIYIPMAQAHLAVENRLSAFFEFARIRSVVRHTGWPYVWWTAGLVFFSLPVFAARGLPTFVEGIMPEFADFTAQQVDDLGRAIALVMSLYIFATLLIFRRRQARIYARAVARASSGADAALWDASVMASHCGGLSDYRPWRAFRPIRFVVMLGLWWCLAALIYIGQFLNHDWHAWVSHPLVFLPWMP